MIKRIEIKNFQSHKDTKINFTPGLSCITGSTHVGKSAFVRALRWTVFNDQFKDFITWGEEKCSVSIFLDNGICITRERDKNLNRYILRDGDKEEIFDSFGLDIPLPIKEVLNTSQIILSENQSFNLNVRSQHDPLFLLTETGTTRAKALNSLIGIHIIDEALKELVADCKRKKIQLDEIVKKIKGLEEEIRSFGDLEFKEKQAYRLKEMFLDAKEKNERLKELVQFIGDCKDFDSRVEKLESRRKDLRTYDFNKIVSLDKSYAEYKELQDISDHVVHYFEREKDLEVRRKEIRKYDKEKLGKLDALVEKFQELDDIFLTLHVFEEDYGLYLQRRKAAETTLVDKKKNYAQIIKELKTCPTCLEVLTDAKIQRIIKDL